MNIYIDQLQINKHFFLPIKNHLEKEDTNEKKNKNMKKLISKIRLYDFFSINEAKICEKVKEIPYFQNHYIILYNYDEIKAGDLRERGIINLDYYSDNKYLLFQYPNNKCILFNDYFYQLTNPKMLILNLLTSFSYLLNSLIRLNEKVCFFNISTKNIVFNYDCGEKPFLIDFQKSINIHKLSEKYITQIIKNTYDYTYKPLEIQLLFYICHNDLETISTSLIEEICENYSKHLIVLQNFSLDYQNSFKTNCRSSLKKYVNVSKELIIKDVLERSSTWDGYSLSILYTHMFCSIIRIFHLKDTFLNKALLLLVKNISPEPSKRETLHNTLHQFEKLYDDYNDWSFVNKISNEKMESLFKHLFE